MFHLIYSTHCSEAIELIFAGSEISSEGEENDVAEYEENVELLKPVT